MTDCSPCRTEVTTAMTLDKWANVPEPEEQEAEDDRKRGFAGKLRTAREGAPVGATDAQIQSVAKEALERSVPTRQVWNERLCEEIVDY
jgi:hypothetical protein